MDTRIVREFWANRSKKKDFRWVDHVDINYDLIMDHHGPGDRLLSLGAGDGVTETMLTNTGFKVTAVDILPKPDNCLVEEWIESDVFHMEPQGKFGTIVAFGLTNSLHLSELYQMYNKAKHLLAPSGVLILKQQSSTNGHAFEVDVDIDGDRYQAIYRPVLGEINHLEEFFDLVTCQRAYPKFAPPHNNSDFFLYQAWNRLE